MPNQSAAPTSRAESLSQIGHDMRTSINHIIGYSELLLEDAAHLPHDGYSAGLQQIHDAGKLLLGMTNEIIAAIKLGNLQLDLTRHDLFASLGQVTDLSATLMAQAQDEGQTSLAADLQKIHSAAMRLLRLINNGLIPSMSIVDGAATAPQPTTSSTAITGTLLVVDDNKTNREMLGYALKLEGHTVVMAENGRQALEMIQTAPFDLVLLDIMMPGIDGYQVLQMLKAEPDYRHIPVIVISAVEETEGAIRCIGLGAEDYLPKPFDLVLLRARINASLEKKRLRDQEIHYLQQVARLTTAAAAVEAGTFDPDSLADVAAREDELGQLARVFQRMAQEVYAREQRLKQQVQDLFIVIDDVKKSLQVAEITDTEYFHLLQEKVRQFRTSSAE
ncbi:MAG: response regulator [Anaerolineae bacterium]|nr:response regulator [Anaerolineae bacterium]